MNKTKNILKVMKTGGLMQINPGNGHLRGGVKVKVQRKKKHFDLCLKDTSGSLFLPF